MRRLATSVVPALAAALLVASPCRGQAHDVDPAAMKAFEALVQAHRARPVQTVKTAAWIEVDSEGATSRGPDVTMDLTFAPGRRARVSISDFTLWMTGGRVFAVHDANADAYVEAGDGGSPYYTLLQAFVDLPYPHLAIALGEDDAREVCMQLHPRAPWIVPTKVETVEVPVDRPAADGEPAPVGDVPTRTLRRFTLSSDFATMELDVDPATSLIDDARLSITGGQFVQAGSTLRYRYDFEHDLHGGRLDPALLTFDPGDRERVETLVDLRPEQSSEQAGDLVGQPAPPIVVPTLDGGRFDLAEHEGRVVVVDFWATWCGPCKAALPKLEEFAAWCAREQLPVDVIAIDVWEGAMLPDDTPEGRLELVRTFVRETGLGLPVGLDHLDETAAAYRVTGIPATFVIRADGIVHAAHTGLGRDPVAQLEDDVRGALAAVEAGDPADGANDPGDGPDG